MHVVFRESHGLEETEMPYDVGQSPADLVVLSFSDSDLGAFAAGWHRGKDDLPSLRLANITALKHPLSVDTYVENTLEGAKAVLVRLIGGIPYWSYGIQQLQDLARRKGIALAVLPADGRPDTRLDDVSTLPKSTLERLTHLCDTGGAVAAQAALAQLAIAAGIYAKPVVGSKQLPDYGGWTPELGVCDPAHTGDAPLVVLTFYRSYVSSADLAPIETMFAALRARGFDVLGLFAPTLKQPEAAQWIADKLRNLQPAAIVNATAFSGKGIEGVSPLDATDAPVFQVALATSRKKAWAESERGLAPADLAMHVVLPEVDGRLFAGVASFKEPGKKDPDLQYSRFGHRAHAERIEAVVQKVAAWVALVETPASEKRVGVVLSTYPGADWNMAHAVGLDALASAEAIIADLTEDGLTTQSGDAGWLGEALGSQTIRFSLEAYSEALSLLPQELREDVTSVWGAPEDDDLVRDGAFEFAAVS
ncbi:cobaltochelatase subunit CobN, partial [Cognatishimia sp.]|uniref:cobaltochelatase subunit CobN n=1 Tax=Cognatishimia sp. TaxID=2211648 RepID=UPI0035119484